MDWLIVFCAQYLIWEIAVLAAIYMLWRARTWDALLLVVVSLPVAWVAARIAGYVYSHVQPFAAQGFTPLIPHVVDNSFPSDHMLLAATIASVVFVYNKRAGIVLWIMALLVGIARVVAGLHYPIDIIASASIAVVIVYAVCECRLFLRQSLQ